MNHDHDTLLVRELRTTLHGLADAHDPAPLPRDLWTQGRAPRTNRLGVVAAVAAVIALIVGLGLAQQSTGALLPAKAPEGGALPKEVHLPQADQVAQARNRGGVKKSTTGIGQISIAALAPGGVPLLVSATDGEHHLVEFPDLDVMLADQRPALHVSPDGWKIAYPVRTRTGAENREFAGIAVLDLKTNEVSTHFGTDQARLPIEVDDIAWSNDSSHVAWTGEAYEPGQGRVDGPTRIASADATLSGVREWKLANTWASELVVGDDGNGLLIGAKIWEFGDLASGQAIAVDSGRRFAPEFSDMASERGAAFSRNSQAVLLGGPHTGSDYFTHLEVDLRSDPLSATRTVWPMDSEGGLYLDLLGLTPDGSVVATQEIGPTSIEKMSAAGNFRRLTTLLSLGDRPFTVAIDLADTEPVGFATPPWVRGPVSWLTVLGLLGVVAIIGAMVARRRRTPRDPGSRLPRGIGDSVGAWTLVVVVLLTALISLSLPWPSVDGLVVPEGALPATIYTPSDYAERYVGDNEPSALDVGRTGATMASSDGGSLLVGAEDGRHRFVALAGGDRTTSMMGNQPLALSPEGTQLAWAYAELAEETSQTRAGIRVADLMTGEISEISLTGPRERAVRVDEIVWSPDGTHLAWRGDEARQWDTGGSNWIGPIGEVGVVTLAEVAGDGTGSAGAGQWSLPQAAARASTIAIGRDGQAFALSGRRLWTLPVETLPDDAPSSEPTSRVVTEQAQDWSGAVISPDDDRLVIGLNDGESANAYASGLMTLDLTDPTSQVAIHPWRDLPDGSGSRPLGWTPDGALVVSHESNEAGDQSGTRTVSVIDADGTAATRTQTDQTDVHVSVATDLAERSVAFSEPVWPRSDERLWVLGLLSVATAGAAYGLVTALRRRRNPAAGGRV